MATDRSTELVLATNVFPGSRVLDIGCGDGFYTVRYWDHGRPSQLVAIDAAGEAVRVAARKSGDRQITHLAGTAHHLPFRSDIFDVALIQSLLHHDTDPKRTIREAFRVAPVVVIHEPNGSNLGLKVIEKVSPYHRAHGERSFTSRRVASWVREAGGKVQVVEWAGLVPMFCPDWLAGALKAAEPIFERTPVLNMVGCAVWAMVAVRNEP